MTDTAKVLEILRSMAAKIEEQREYLTELDQPIGDSDHGINMARGFAEVVAKLPALEGKDIGNLLKSVGMTLVSKIGGSSGPLYGSAFMKAGMKVLGKMELEDADWLIMLEEAVEAVKQRGKATVGEKTMLDAMVPALEEIRRAQAAGLPCKEALQLGVKAAWDGVEHTKELIATKGRASYVGERGIGHQDPGATSFAFLLEVIADSL